MGAAAIPLAILGTPLAVAGIDAMSDAAKAAQTPDMPAPAPQKEAPDQYNRMRQQQEKDRLRRGLAATMKTGGMGDTSAVNLSAPSLLGGNKNLLGQ